MTIGQVISLALLAVVSAALLLLDDPRALPLPEGIRAVFPTAEKRIGEALQQWQRGEAISREQQRALQIAAVVTGLVAALFAAPFSRTAAGLVAAAGAGFAFALPLTFRGETTRRRAEAVEDAVPGFVAHLYLRFEEGLIEALESYAAHRKGPLAEDIRKGVKLLAVGVRPRDFFETLGKRYASAYLQTLGSQIEDLLESGNPRYVLGLLLDQAIRDAEHRRLRQIEQRTMLVLFVNVFTLLPALFAVILEPAVYTFLERL